MMLFIVFLLAMFGLPIFLGVMILSNLGDHKTKIHPKNILGKSDGDKW